MKAESRRQKAEVQRSRSAPIALILISAFCFLPSALSACPVCFGDPSSKLTMGAQNGILFLLGIIGFVQIGFIALFWSFWRRAKALRERREQFQLIEGDVLRDHAWRTDS
jgi:hypothetical protein